MKHIKKINELRSDMISGTKSGWIDSLEDRKYELKKDVKGAQIGNFTNVLLPKGTIIYNLPGGVFADHFSLKNKYASKSSRGPQYFEKPTFSGISIRQKPDTLAAIEKNSKVLESVNEGMKKITKQLWKRMNDDKRFDALLSVVKDPDDAEEYIHYKWEDLPSGFERDMVLYEGKALAKLMAMINDGESDEDILKAFPKLSSEDLLGWQDTYANDYIINKIPDKVIGESVNETTAKEVHHDAINALTKTFGGKKIDKRFVKDYLASIERMARKDPRNFVKDYGEFDVSDWIEDAKYNLQNEGKVNEVKFKSQADVDKAKKITWPNGTYMTLYAPGKWVKHDKKTGKKTTKVSSTELAQFIDYGKRMKNIVPVYEGKLNEFIPGTLMDIRKTAGDMWQLPLSKKWAAIGPGGWRMSYTSHPTGKKNAEMWAKSGKDRFGNDEKIMARDYVDNHDLTTESAYGDHLPTKFEDYTNEVNNRKAVNEAKFVKDFDNKVLGAETEKEILKVYPKAIFFVGKHSHFFGELEPNLFFKAYYKKYVKKRVKEFLIVTVYSKKGSNYVNLYSDYEFVKESEDKVNEIASAKDGGSNSSGKSHEGDHKKASIIDTWKETYGEDFHKHYPAIAKILKQRPGIDKRELKRIWTETYGESFDEEYPALWAKLD